MSLDLKPNDTAGIYMVVLVTTLCKDINIANHT